MNPLDAMTLDELVRLWANEALRLFHDRLVTQEEQDWCQEKVGRRCRGQGCNIRVSPTLTEAKRRGHRLDVVRTFTNDDWFMKTAILQSARDLEHRTDLPALWQFDASGSLFC